MISYIGGKGRIGKWIEPHIPKDIETYVEPFGGMFWVFTKLNLDDYPNLTTVVYNDYNKLNTNLFKCTKDYDRLWEELSKYPCQQMGVVDTPPEYKELHKECQKEIFDPNYVIGDEPNFDAAAKYVYVLTQVFSGSKPETSPYTDYKGKYRCKVLVFMDKLKNEKFRKQIDKITFIENLNYTDVIQKYDSPTTYFYLDPPYWKTEDYYSKHDFDADDHKLLATQLQTILGKFSLSYYDFELLHEWFPESEYTWKSKEFNKAAASKVGSKGTELLIMNYLHPVTITIPKKHPKKLEIICRPNMKLVIGGEYYFYADNEHWFKCKINKYDDLSGDCEVETIENLGTGTYHQWEVIYVGISNSVLGVVESTSPGTSAPEIDLTEVIYPVDTVSEPVNNLLEAEQIAEKYKPTLDDIEEYSKSYKTENIMVTGSSINEVIPTIDDKIDELTYIIFDNLFGDNSLISNTDENKMSIIRSGLLAICKECEDMK